MKLPCTDSDYLSITLSTTAVILFYTASHHLLTFNWRSQGLSQPRTFYMENSDSITEPLGFPQLCKIIKWRPWQTLNVASILRQNIESIFVIASSNIISMSVLWLQTPLQSRQDVSTPHPTVQSSMAIHPSISSISQWSARGPSLGSVLFWYMPGRRSRD